MIFTPRLAFRPFRDDDVAVLYDFMHRADAMRYTYVAPSPAQLASRLRTYEALRLTLGCAPWVVLERASMQVIGWGGLSVDPEVPGWGLEVSYAFAPASWGNGYATELVRYAVQHALTALGVAQVHAFAMPQNVASIRVLQKSGFKMAGYEPALERNHYVVSAQDQAAVAGMSGECGYR